MNTPLITPQGFSQLQQELDFLWRVERPEITAKVTWAASLGDRSENADYKENKRRLREIDRRLRYLKKRLDSLKVIHPSPEQYGKVFFGAAVALEREDGTLLSIKIVGYDEIFGRKDYISIDSPMARALLKKQVDDDVVVTTPNGDVCWTVLAIDYTLEPQALKYDNR